MSDKVRVRFAPSPTGDLHVGNVRTALYNWFFAKKNNGELVLRLEDTDKERSSEEAVENLLEALEWLGLDFQEGPKHGGAFGPYRQSERYSLYREVLERLEKEGKAYPCFCTEEELDAERKIQLSQGKAPMYSGRCRGLSSAEREEKKKSGAAFSMRFAASGEPVEWEDLVRGTMRFPADAVGDFILARSDGSPTFHLTVVVDDALMKITHVIRGEDHLPNTPRHIQLAKALGFSPPRYAHLSLLKGPDGQKLSKRHGETGISYYRKNGYPPEGLLNYLALLGWTPPGGEEVQPIRKLAEQFDLSAVHKSAAVFDPVKLRFVCSQHLSRMPLEEVTRKVLPYLEEAGLLTRQAARERFDWLKSAVETIRGNLACFADAVEWMQFYLNEELLFEQETVKELTASVKILRCFFEAFSETTGDLTAQTFQDVCRKVAAACGAKGKALFHPLRLALTGKAAGPELAKMVPLLGKEKVLSRLSVWVSEGAKGGAG